MLMRLIKQFDFGFFRINIWNKSDRYFGINIYVLTEEDKATHEYEMGMMASSVQVTVFGYDISFVWE